MTKKRLKVLALILALVLLAVLAVDGCLYWATYMRTSVKYETTTQVKPFAKIAKDDPNMDAGTSAVQQKGVNGTVKVTYKLVYRGKLLLSKTKVKEQLVKKPVDEITLVGTKVAPTYPATAEDVIRAYYAAINGHRWDEAWGYLTARQQAVYSVPNPGPDMAAWTGIERFLHSYGDYVQSVSVTDVTPFGGAGNENTYLAHFEAEYIKPYPAGTHKLPTVHAMKRDEAGKWKIDEIGTG